MKKLFFGAVAFAVVSLSSFTSIDVSDDAVVHNCTYRMYGNGEFLGMMTLYDVPDNISCDSQQAKQVAITNFNAALGN